MAILITATRPAGWMSADGRIGYTRDLRLAGETSWGPWSIYALSESQSFRGDQAVLDWSEVNYPAAMTLPAAREVVAAAWQHPKYLSDPPCTQLRARAWYDCKGIPYTVVKTTAGKWVLVRRSITDVAGADHRLRGVFDNELRACLFDSKRSALAALADWRTSYLASEG